MNNTQINNVKDIDAEMPMNNLIEYSNNYSKISEVYDNTTEIHQMTT